MVSTKLSPEPQERSSKVELSTFEIKNKNKS